MLDQFSKKPVIQKFLKIKDFDLHMQTNSHHKWHLNVKTLDVLK